MIDSEAKKTIGLTPEDLSRMSEFEVKQYSQITQPILEKMLIGYLISSESVNDDKFGNTRNAELLMESGIKGFHFDEQSHGDIYDDLISYYRSSRQLLTTEDAVQRNIAFGQKTDTALVYRDFLSKCHTSAIGRRIKLDILIRRMKTNYRNKMADKVIQKFIKDRIDENIGPDKAIDNFRSEIAKSLITLGSEQIKEHDPLEDYDKIIGWMRDMKNNPDKYRGLSCGIGVVDKKTTGFKRQGHLTVFVGKHGGYKSTVMMNVGYGLWERGANVLYVSLEMEGNQVLGKFYSRGSGASWSRLYNGQISEPQDHENLKIIDNKLLDTTLSVEQRKKLEDQKNTLRISTAGLSPNGSKEDLVLLNEFKQKIAERKNKFKFITMGLSQKIKISAIERYIEDRLENFKPDVVIVDYLALVASDTPYPDRRDLEVGDVCKHMRAMGARMGFDVVTAAQYKRAAIDRIRKFGFASPEKAGLGTDDIAESNQIGADADTVFMLWFLDAGSRLMFLTAKARHSQSDNETGEQVQVYPDMCLISDKDIESTKDRSSTIDIEEANERFTKPRPKMPNIIQQEEFDSDLIKNEEPSKIEVDGINGVRESVGFLVY